MTKKKSDPRKLTTNRFPRKLHDNLRRVRNNLNAASDGEGPDICVNDLVVLGCQRVVNDPPTVEEAQNAY